MESITLSFRVLSENLLNSFDKYNPNNLIPYLKNTHHLKEESTTTAIKIIQQQFTRMYTDIHFLLSTVSVRGRRKISTETC